MQYRTIGKTGLSASALGLGCMRLPVLGGKKHVIDEEQALQMVDLALKSGINYFDTAYPYHGEGAGRPGHSEPFLGKALQAARREDFLLATKMPIWQVQSQADMDRILNEQLERLQTSYLDFYLLHAANARFWPKIRDLGVGDFLDRARADGRIRHTGFSFHDNFSVFIDVCASYPWDVCQIQFNYMDEDFQAGLPGLLHAVGMGLGVIVMEPLRGGVLARNVPDSVKEVMGSADGHCSPAEWALRYVWNQPGVSVVLSGMSSLAQLEENLASADRPGALPGNLTYREIDMFEEVKRRFRARVAVDCTGCQYCMPCPNGVNIPANFEAYNNAAMYSDLAGPRLDYRLLESLGEDAGQCTACGMCEIMCPQLITIGETMEEVAKLLG